MTAILHKNQPHEVPQGPDDHAPLGRRTMLGTGGGPCPWTMFMPGQSQGVPSERPEDWPGAGRLLRVPKVVFLTSCPPAHLWGRNFTLVSKWSPFGYLGHYDDALGRDTRYSDPTVNGWGSQVFQGYLGTYGYIGWTIDPQYPPDWEGRRKFWKCCVVPNAIYNEHYRLNAAFREAKAELERRYPGEVFVRVTEFFPPDPAMTLAPNDELSPRVIDCYTPAGVAANAPRDGANGPPWLLGPDVGQTPAGFFGTNFLHIYCGYQSDGGTGRPRSIEDVVSRWHWPTRVWGYKLDRNFGPGFDKWQETEATPGGYESWSYDATLNYMRTLLGGAGGKLDLLRRAAPNFAGYKVALHEYDGGWSIPPARFMPGGAFARFPPYSVEYGDQDWVEQTIILFISWQIQSVAAAGNPDQYYGTGYGGVRGDEFYNQMNRFPPSSWYTDMFNPVLKQQRDLLAAELLNLGPKAAAIWKTLIDEFGLGDLGIAYEGGSSALTAGSIVAYVEAHYGLKP